VFNLFWLRDLGAMIESRRGSLFMAVIVLVTAVLSNLAQYYSHRAEPPNFGGLSGVVYGLLGYAWLKGRYDPGAGIGVSRDTVTIMLLWLVLCVVGIVPHVANTAHFVGLLVGCAFAAVPHWIRRSGRR
jgi:GlpG protein